MTMRSLGVLALALALLGSAARAEDPPATKPRISLADLEDAFLEVVEKVRPGVVAIEVKYEGDRELAQDLCFSGVVWDGEGTIVAIGRDLESAHEILVSPFEGEPVKAKFVGLDDETGIAVLRVEGAKAGLRALEHGPDGGLRAGSFCVAVGNPVGLRHSVAFGHVAATGRTVRRGGVVTKDAIQVTLPVNPGDPGGLLADSRGRLVGVLASALRRSEPPIDFGDIFRRLTKGNEGRPPNPADLERNLRQARRALEPGLGFFTENVSFAIPVAEVTRAVERVKKGSNKPWLGIDVFSAEDLDEDERKELGVEAERGAIVKGVRSGSPAAKASIKARDVILTWNGDSVKNWRDLRKFVQGTTPGTEVKLEVLRGKERLTVPVTIEGRGGTPPAPQEKKP